MVPPPAFSVEECAARLQRHLKVCSTRYPQAWRTFDQFRAPERKLVDWPAWCFCPTAGAYAIVCHQHGVESLEAFGRSLARARTLDEQSRSPALDVSRLAGLAAWRPGQGVYVIDPTVMKAVMETKVSGSIPVDVLLMLPQWCVYVPVPGGTMLGREFAGFYAFLEHDTNHKRTELRFLFDYLDVDPFYSLSVDVLFLVPGSTLDDCYTQAIEHAHKDVSEKAMDTEESRAAKAVLMKAGGERLAPYLSLLLYLCSQTAEYRPAGSTEPGKPSLPTEKKTKREGWRFFPPDRPHFWFIGERLGDAIREAQQSERSHTGSHAGPRPHIRNAHWHGFWHGPRKGPGIRKFLLRWLPPIAVALIDDTPQARMKVDKLKPIRDLESEVSEIQNELEARDVNPGQAE